MRKTYYYVSVGGLTMIHIAAGSEKNPVSRDYFEITLS
jgi:hypothetical protein